MEYSDIIIIGAGAAGMMAAAGAAETFSRFPESPERKVTVLEKMPRPGRKIMITGKGKCNITNTRPWNDFSGHIHPKSAPLKAAFYSFSTADTVRFFNDNGLGTVVERGERIFPASHMAKDVVDTLVRAVSAAGATIKTGCCVSSVSAGSGSRGAMFLIRCGNGMEFSCRKLIIATGGLSYPGTGSTGDGYGWARGFGHTIKRCFPSLTALVPEGYKNLSPGGRQPSGDTSGGHIDRSVPLSETGAMLEGNRLKNVSLTLFIDGNPVQEEFGDLDFTDGGLEGAVGFKISRKCVKALINGSKAAVSIDLKPAVDKTALEKRIASLWQEISDDPRSRGKSYSDRFRILLGKLLPASLVQGFRRCCQNIDHRTLASGLKNWKMDIRGYVGYERCVITAGGVSTDEITAKTMESRLCPGLYFAGEILDMDGDTGGYNLQTAFSTGMLAGKSAAGAIIKSAAGAGAPSI